MLRYLVKLSLCASCLAVLLLTAWRVGLGDSPTALARPPLEAPRPGAGPEIAALVEQLGHASFTTREAASAKLAKIGLPAKPALLLALKHRDAEVRLRSRRLLGEIVAADYQARLKAFIDDKEGKLEHDLPGWDRYRGLVGEDKVSRELFAAMHQAEPALLETAASGGDVAAEIVQLRCFQLFRGFQFAGGAKQLSFPGIAALLFVSGDERAKISETTLMQVYNFIHQQPFQQALQNGPHKEHARKLLGGWIERSTGPMVAQQSIMLAMQWNLPQGLSPARKLAGDKNTSPYVRANAVLALGKLGGRSEVALLQSLLKDTGICANRVTVTADGKRIENHTQIRDLALAVLIHLTGQQHKEYGLDKVQTNPQMLFNYASIFFANPEARDAALKKWEQWAAKNPPDKVQIKKAEPKEPAKEAGAIGGGGIFFGGIAAPMIAVAGDQAVEKPKPAEDLDFYMVDREIVVRLNRARQLIAERQYAGAVRFLDEVLAKQQPGAYQAELSRPIYQSLRIEAQRVLSMLDDDGRAAYELMCGAEARRALDAAVTSGDAAKLSAVAGRYLFTQAGQEATLLWGGHLLDAGQPLAAAVVLERLRGMDRGGRFEPVLSARLATAWLQAGMPQEARTVLARQGQRGPTSEIEVNGRRLPPLDNVESAFAALQSLNPSSEGAAETKPGDWAVFRGNPQRNAASEADEPWLRARWRVETVRHPAARAAIDALTKAYRDERISVLPSGHAIAAGGAVLARTASEVLALDGESGEVNWSVPLVDSVDELLSAPGGDKLATASELYRGLDDRLFGDLTYGTLASDGRLAFLVEDLGFAYGVLPERMVIRPNGSRRLDAYWPSDYNRLTAYDIRTGKLQWEIGGPRGTMQFDSAGTFFLGPPLPLAGRLYVLGEVDDKTYLVTLDAQTGGVIQRDHLATVEQVDQRLAMQVYGYGQLPERVPRRMSGASPAFGGGVLVCPTSGESFVAWDMTTRQILWSYRPMRSESENGRLNGLIGFGMPLGQRAAGNHPADRDLRWADTSPTIAGQQVLLTPREGERVLCLELRTGRLLWEAPRLDSQYVAGVQGDVALLVGGGSVRGLRLADGQAAYTVKLPAGEAASGRGYLSSGRYYLPLTSAEVAVIDVASGRLLQRSRSREGRVPGNLVCYRNQVLSQSPSGIEAYERLSAALEAAATKLRQRPSDPAALAEQGEVLVFAGRFAEAIAQLRRSLQIRPDEKARTLLCETVLQALEADFAAYQPTATELAGVFVEAGKEAVYYRALAEGLRKSEQREAAIAAYLKLAELGAKNRQVEPIETALATRRDMWLQGQLAELHATSAPAQRAQMDRLIAAQFAKATGAKDPEALREFIDHFGFHPLAEQARQQLVSRIFDFQTGKLTEAEWRPLQVEQHLLQLRESADVVRSRAATACLARLMAAHGRAEEAAVFYRKLAAELADVVCLDGKTGRQLVAELPAKSPWRAALEPAEPWPLGAVEKQTSPNLRFNYQQRRWPLQLDGVRNWLFEDLGLEITTGGMPQKIVARDMRGAERWNVELKTGDQPAYAFSPQMVRARGEGHLLVVWQGNRISGVDTLGGGQGAVMWTKDLSAKFPGTLDVQTYTQSVMVFAGGAAVPVFRAVDAFGRPLGELGPVTGRLACYQRSRQLVAVDPLSGETLWTRYDVPRGSELWGDSEVILAVPPESSEARVLRASDGQELARREVPSARDRVATIGRYVVTWRSHDRGSELAAVDPWKNGTAWKREFAAGAKMVRAGTDQAAVLEPQGKFAVVSLADGKSVLDTTLEPQRDLIDVLALRWRGGWVLVGKQTVPAPAAGAEPDMIYPISMGGRAELVTGKVYGFDRGGKQLWSRTVIQQGLDLGQPADTPVLVFAQRTYTRKAGPARQDGKILCLDKRDGRVLYEENLDQTVGQLQMVADAANHAVEIRHPRAGTKLTFTGKPLPAK
jgi:outer membrane protein assembly factor BamB